MFFTKKSPFESDLRFARATIIRNARGNVGPTRLRNPRYEGHRLLSKQVISCLFLSSRFHLSNFRIKILWITVIMDGFSSDQWNNIDGMVYFILFDGTEQSCWAYLCTFQPGAQYGRLPKLRETVDKIYDLRPSLAGCFIVICPSHICSV